MRTEPSESGLAVPRVPAIERTPAFSPPRLRHDRARFLRNPLSLLRIAWVDALAIAGAAAALLPLLRSPPVSPTPTLSAGTRASERVGTPAQQ
jgi:hypothetical protein